MSSTLLLPSAVLGCPRRQPILGQAGINRKVPARRVSPVVCASGESSEVDRGQSGAASPPVMRPFNRRAIMGLLGLSPATGLLGDCPCCNQVAKADDLWGYGQNWEGVCATGQFQSPIDIPIRNSGKVGTSGPMGDIEFNYSDNVDVAVINNGKGSPTVTIPGGNTMKVGGKEYTLVQYHFHAPSEHAFDGIRLPLEAHFVHKSKEGKLAVVGVLLQRGAAQPNEALQMALTYGPPQPSVVERIATCIDIRDMVMKTMPPPNDYGHRPYVHYQGSLTTPPCSEGVQWFVMATPGSCTDSQVLDFQTFVGNQRTLARNTRPLQPLGSRILEYDAWEQDVKKKAA